MGKPCDRYKSLCSCGFRCSPRFDRPAEFSRLLTILALTTLIQTTGQAADATVTPVGTQPFTLTDDPAETLVNGVDRFLLKQIEQTRIRRIRSWDQVQPGQDGGREFLVSRRSELLEMLGIREHRATCRALEEVGTTHRAALVANSDRIEVRRIRWPVLPDPAPGRADLVSVTGEGLLLTPRQPPQATVIAIPDADQTPEQLCGLVDDIPADQQFARRLADAGFQVIVPALISRHTEARLGRATMTDREFIYRGSYVLGEHIIGYELQKVFALADMLQVQDDNEDPFLGIIGYGEGGMLALLAAAIDSRFDSVGVSGWFGPRENSWQEPLSRNVFGLLNDFGAAQLAAMAARPVLVEAAAGPAFEFAQNGGAPSVLLSPTAEQVQQEARTATEQGARLQVTVPEDGRFGSTDWLQQFASTLPGNHTVSTEAPAELTRSESDLLVRTFAASRRLRQLQELDRHNQAMLRESPFLRKALMAALDTSSVEAFEASQAPLRRRFRDDVIGRFDLDLLPPNAHSRVLKQTDKWTAHEVWLDVFPDVGAYGVLLLPKDLKDGEQRPVVVCQHGLEGRPTDTFLNDHRAYHDYAAKLCEQGFITFAPQNIYIFEDRFRTLQRKANPMGKTLFSVMVPQHQQIINWLKSQPFVDGDRIAFYGLSYGGKSAMRIPALVTDYCLSICSADFNEWVLKNASTRHRFSYVWTGEYEIFEWNLGQTFNYAEMAALICPRPFMVERGHFDGVGEDEWVAHEYAKIRHLYAAQLKIPERTEIEWFDGPHTINGQATFDFLHRHLNWQAPNTE